MKKKEIKFRLNLLWKRRKKYESELKTIIESFWLFFFVLFFLGWIDSESWYSVSLSECMRVCMTLKLKCNLSKTVSPPFRSHEEKATTIIIATEKEFPWNENRDDQIWNETIRNCVHCTHFSCLNHSWALLLPFSPSFVCVCVFLLSQVRILQCQLFLPCVYARIHGHTKVIRYR